MGTRFGNLSERNHFYAQQPNSLSKPSTFVFFNLGNDRKTCVVNVADFTDTMLPILPDHVRQDGSHDLPVSHGAVLVQSFYEFDISAPRDLWKSVI